MFAGTLRENLAYLRPEATDEETGEAVRLLGMAPLAERIGGYHAEVQASGLSAGERQLVTLVRAYLSPARLVLLDEAACHLDPAAEGRVEQAFAARPGTLIVIAHRISSALRAQRILVLDGAGIAAGTHDELLAASALYRDLMGHWTGAPVVAPGNGRRPAPVNGEPPTVRDAFAQAAALARDAVRWRLRAWNPPRHRPRAPGRR